MNARGFILWVWFKDHSVWLRRHESLVGQKVCLVAIQGVMGYKVDISGGGYMGDETRDDTVVIGPHDALVVVDVQNDFMPQGALPVPGGDRIVPGINAAMERFAEGGQCVVLTQDWHPPGHLSFASAHPAKRPYEAHEEPGIGPVLWPDHCVQGTAGADFHPGLDITHAQAVIRKGWRRNVDSYSGFLENDRQTHTGLAGYLRERGVNRIFVCGLALDYCVFFTACDGAALGFQTYVIRDLSMAVGSPPGREEEVQRVLAEKGVRMVVLHLLA